METVISSTSNAARGIRYYLMLWKKTTWDTWLYIPVHLVMISPQSHFQSPRHLPVEPSPVHKSPLFVICLSYACDANTSFISLVVLSYPCHIPVIINLKKKIYLVCTNQYQTSKRYAKPQKDVLGIYAGSPSTLCHVSRTDLPRRW